MIKITGQYSSAVCYTDSMEEPSKEQILRMCNQKIYAGQKIRIMPDVHAGKGCTIGTTMSINGRVTPDLVGVDIGCGMETVRFAEKEVDFEALDNLIRKKIPYGMNIRKSVHPFCSGIALGKLRCLHAVNVNRAELSLGTLGGGNHFIEIDRDSNGFLYLVIHSGSRYLGKQTAEYYQELGWRKMIEKRERKRMELVDGMKNRGEFSRISEELSCFDRRESLSQSDREFAYVEGSDFDDYIHDMRIVQQYAAMNRAAMASVIIEGLGLHETDRFTTIHNYIDTEKMILRKGSVSARKGERLLIPISMSDGAYICIGKGNPEWNCSAPHGAGRLMSRNAARRNCSMEEFTRRMSGIYTTCVSESTIDESPMAYKNPVDILSQINDTAEVIEKLTPVFSFKSPS